MAELGQVMRIHNAATGEDMLMIFLPRSPSGGIPTIGGLWQRVSPHAIEGLGDLAEGTVIDHDALLRRGEVVVVREPPTRMDDETFAALLGEAEAMGKAEL